MYHFSVNQYNMNMQCFVVYLLNTMVTAAVIRLNWIKEYSSNILPMFIPIPVPGLAFVTLLILIVKVFSTQVMTISFKHFYKIDHNNIVFFVTSFQIPYLNDFPVLRMFGLETKWNTYCLCE